jgi:hypothetical protein
LRRQASTGANEAIDLRDGGLAFGGLRRSERCATFRLRLPSAARNAGMDQEAIDRRLS